MPASALAWAGIRLRYCETTCGPSGCSPPPNWAAHRMVASCARPDSSLTASGATFLTLDDETGHVNVVVWRDLAERQRRELLGARLLAVYGTLERQGEVAHLIARHLRDLTPLLGDLVTHSRDFH